MCIVYSKLFSQNNSDFDVAMVSPGGVPWVLDEPVIMFDLVFIGTIADGEDGVI